MIFKGMKEKKTVMIFLIVLWIQLGYSQSALDDTLSKRYIGLSGGLSPEVYKYSTYLFELGGQILYNWNREYISFLYNRLFAFHFDDEYDDSKFHRFELVYGRVSCLKEDHKLFRYIFVHISIGVSYNIISYYEDDIAYYRNRISKTRRFGIPIGISITGPTGKSFYGGIGYNFHIIANDKPYINIKYFLMVNVL